jgi:hypothetical protein
MILDDLVGIEPEFNQFPRRLASLLNHEVLLCKTIQPLRQPC